MDDVNGGNSEDVYDSVVVTHYDRLFWFFPFVYMRFIVRNMHQIVQANFLQPNRHLLWAKRQRQRWRQWW